MIKQSHLYRFFQIICLLFLLAMVGQAQIQPPDFICVRNDTLLWNAPVNTCGAFQNYRIFASQNKAGPYEILAEIDDFNTTSFVHPTSTSQTWFYYLESDYDCPGLPSLPSDTLNNQLPAISPVQFVTVEGENVRIQWEPNDAADIVGHIVYRETPGGRIPIDTVFEGNSYVDTNASPTTQSESYFVLAVDACESTSLFDEPQRTIFATAEVNSCSQRIALEWNLYQNWPEGIAYHQVWRIDDQGNEILLADSILAAATLYNLRNVEDETDYCLYVAAVRAGSGVVSRANVVCLRTDIVQPNRDLLVKGATTLPDNTIQLDWQWTATAEMQNYQILRSTDGENFSVIVESAPPTPLSLNNTFVDTDVNAPEGPFFYQIRTEDDCGEVATSNTASTIRLQARADDQVNFLNWTPLQMPEVAVLTYELVRVNGGRETVLTTLPQGNSDYDDILAGFAPEEVAVLCYYIDAQIVLPLPQGGFDRREIRSNLVCVEQPLRILTPNAFTPNGKNPEFRPVLQFGTAETFELYVYNRYGELVFQSEDPNIGWLGRDAKGSQAPGGVYVYQIVVRQANGRRIEDKGTVLLLR